MVSFTHLSLLTLAASVSTSSAAPQDLGNLLGGIVSNAGGAVQSALGGLVSVGSGALNSVFSAAQSDAAIAVSSVQSIVAEQESKAVTWDSVAKTQFSAYLTKAEANMQSAVQHASSIVGGRTSLEESVLGNVRSVLSDGVAGVSSQMAMAAALATSGAQSVMQSGSSSGSQSISKTSGSASGSSSSSSSATQSASPASSVSSHNNAPMYVAGSSLASLFALIAWAL